MNGTISEPRCKVWTLGDNEGEKAAVYRLSLCSTHVCCEPKTALRNNNNFFKCKSIQKYVHNEKNLDKSKMGRRESRMTQQPGDWKKTSYPQREEVRKRAPVFRAEYERGGQVWTR